MAAEPLTRRFDPVLAACLAAAAALRLWGISYGLPHVYNPDEVSIMSRALALGGGDLNPHNFLYPSLYFYVLAAAVGVYFAALWLTGWVGSLDALEAAFWRDPSEIYLVGRLLSAGAGVLTVGVTYALARRIGDRAVARAAAALMTAAYIPVRDAHFVKHDVPVTLVIALVALAAWRVWQNGRARDYAAAGALAGIASAMHYYAIFSIAPIAAVHLLRVRGGAPFLSDRRPWIAALACVVTFACLTPYLLIDLDVALRDIAANRGILIDRTVATYGTWGAAREHARLILTQGAGVLMTAAAVAGAVLLVRRAPAHAAWLLSFPMVFFLFISNSWPFGRTQNPLYPFLAILAAAAILSLARRIAPGRPAVAAGLTIACAAQPLALAILMDRLMARTDTRTVAKNWLERHVPAGSGVAIQPYSVPLVPTRARLEQALTANVGGAERAGYRFRTALAADPYPSPAFKLYYLGSGGLDQDKIYYDPDALLASGRLEALVADGLAVVALKRFTRSEPDRFRDRLRDRARLVFVSSPFDEGAPPGEEAVLPDYDVRPSLAVERPGPLIEIWALAGADRAGIPDQ